MGMIFNRTKTLLVLLLLFSNSCRAQDTPTPVETQVFPEQSTPSPLQTPTLIYVPTETANPAPSATSTLEPGTYRNPVLDHDFPDPDILLVGDIYYAFSTNSDGVNIPIAHSTDLVDWELLGEALPRLPDWAVASFGWAWAPGLADPRESEDYVMYYTARFAIGFDGMQCLGLATSPDPQGPYQPQGSEPFICQRGEGGSIDAEYFVDEDGSQYLLWKSDSNSQGGAPDIYIQQLSPDGHSLVGEPVSLMTVDRRWEGLVVEGPTLWEREGKYYLFYSANDYASEDYAVGYAVADSPTGPFTKAQDPLLTTDIQAGIIGPGGQDIVTGPDGETWMLFHMWRPAGYRAMGLARLEWDGDTPSIPILTREPMPAPQAGP
jgi:arabinan endo-1,5-alpha-L-arabinosidase